MTGEFLFQIANVGGGPCDACTTRPGEFLIKQPPDERVENFCGVCAVSTVLTIFKNAGVSLDEIGRAFAAVSALVPYNPAFDVGQFDFDVSKLDTSTESICLVCERPAQRRASFLINWPALMNVGNKLCGSCAVSNALLFFKNCGLVKLDAIRDNFAKLSIAADTPPSSLLM